MLLGIHARTNPRTKMLAARIIRNTARTSHNGDIVLGEGLVRSGISGLVDRRAVNRRRIMFGLPESQATPLIPFLEGNDAAVRAHGAHLTVEGR